MKSRGLRKSLIMIVVAFVIMIGGMIAVLEQVNAAGITTSSIDAVCKKYGYSNGKYWTYGKYDGNTYSTSSPKRNKGYVASTVKGYHGSQTDRNWNGYVYYSQEECHGFACFVMHCVTGTEVIPRDVKTDASKNGWTKLGANSVTCLKIGDIVRANGHSAIVYKDLGKGNFQFLQVWGGYNKVDSWGNNAINYGKFSASASSQASNLSELKKIGITYVYRYGEKVPEPSTIANSTIKQIPSTLKQGSSWECEGTVSSNYKLKYVNGYILKNTGKSKTWDEQIVYKVEGTDLKSNTVNSYKLISSKINTGLLFNKLSPGNYYYIITGRDMTDALLERIQKFSVISNTPAPTNNKPVGYVDSVTCDQPGWIHVKGWAYDPDAKGTSLNIHVYVGGASSPSVPCTSIKANVKRTDVNKAYGCGDYHGFDAQIPTNNKSGKIDVYIYAIDASGGTNPLLGKKTADVASATPIGSFEKVESVAADKIHVVGWAYDPDTKDKAITITVYIGGQCGTAGVESRSITANIKREDVNKSKACGIYHGFDAIITTGKRGSQPIYVWAINTDGSAANINTNLGSKTVNIHDCNHTKTVPTPSCTKTLTGTDKCSICGKVHSTWSIAPIGHKYNSGEITKAATCTEDGVITFTCTVCGDKKTEIISKTGHTIVADNAVAPTYTATGLTEGSHCSVCQQVIVKQETVPMLVKEEKPVDIISADDSAKVDDKISQTDNANREDNESNLNSDTGSEDVKDIDIHSDVEEDDKDTDTNNDVEDDDENVFEIGDVLYEITGKKEVKYLFNDADTIKVAVIPDTVKYNNVTYAVTSIADEAFNDCKSLKKLTIGKNITKIGKTAFKGCKNLKAITIKSTKLTKKSFGKNAFKGINKKATIKVPKKQLKNYKKWVKQAGAPKTVKVKK